MKGTRPAVSMNFDFHAGNYRQLLDESVRLSGESADYFAQAKARYLLRSFGECFSGTILDFGCGVGILSRALVQTFPKARVDGYDTSERSISEVPPAAANRGVFTSRWTDLRSDYDLIVVANVVHHIPPEQRQEIISSIASRLLRGGKLFIFEHNPFNPLTRRCVRLCPFDAGAILLRPAELRRYLGRAGLKIEARDYTVFFPRLLRWLRPLEPKLNWCGIGAQYVMVASLRGGRWHTVAPESVSLTGAYSEEKRTGYTLILDQADQQRLHRPADKHGCERGPPIPGRWVTRQLMAWEYRATESPWLCSRARLNPI